MEENKSDLLWIFGYGSLIWKPPEGFHHVEETAGFIKGWERRFWQGSTDHRGIPGAPGLVATLLRGDRLRSEEHAASGGEEDSICWGKAYAYGEDERERIIQYLDFREKNGYERTQVDVHRSSGPPIPNAVLYVATPDNYEYCGPLTNEACAQQIARSVGPSGTNAEYLLNLAEALRSIGAADPHVFELERRIKLLPPPPPLPEGAGSAVSAFVGDGSCAGDGGWMLQRLWEAVGEGEWAVIPGKAGVYTHVGDEACDILAKAGWPASMPSATIQVGEDLQKLTGLGGGDAQLAKFPDGGGLISMKSQTDGGGFEHRLMTESFCTAAHLK